MKKFFVCVGLLFVIFASFSSISYGYDYPDCVNGPLAKYDICNSSLPIQQRVQSLVNLMNVTEKIGRVTSGFGAPNPAIPRLGLPELQWINDALHGLTQGPNFQYVNGNGDWNSSTSFPSPINFAATFDDRLPSSLGHYTGVEARAFTNANRGGVDLWTPNINPFRDPRWGRGQEVPGEDPYVGGRYAENYVKGMQQGEDPRYYLAVADCKHYAAYDLENWEGEDRYHFSANVTLQDLVEYFLPPFESCVRDGHAGTIMCSYNALNEIPTCADPFLLETIAREEWGFGQVYDGVILSDCDAVDDIYSAHKYTKTPEEAAALALLAGTDLDCGSFYQQHLQDAINQGLVNESTLDVAVTRLTASLVRIGYFDPPEMQPYRQYGWEHVETADAVQTSYLAALRSQVLLKNDNNLLPLSSTQSTTIAVIGPLQNDTYYIQGNYRGKPSYVINIWEGINNQSNVKIISEQGCDVESNKTDGFSAAVAAAALADYTIFVGGLTEGQEAEGKDRVNITWPGVQEELILDIAKASRTPIILLVAGGGQIDLSLEKNNTKVGAILWNGYPSQEGGRAIADILFGRVSPSGRLVTTQYPGDYVNQVSMEDMNLRPNKTTGNPGRTYRFYTGEPIYPFGYGLHYTTFDYKFFNPFNMESERTRYSIDDLIESPLEKQMHPSDYPRSSFAEYACNVTNTGKVASDVSVLLFVSSNQPDAPIQQLTSFQRIDLLQPGVTQTLYFTVTLDALSTVDQHGDKYILPGEYTFFVGHAGYAATKHIIELHGDAKLLKQFPKPNHNQMMHQEKVRKAFGTIEARAKQGKGF